MSFWESARDVPPEGRLYREAARERDEGRCDPVSAAKAKLFASDVVMKVTTDAVQAHGGHGHMREYNVER